MIELKLVMTKILLTKEYSPKINKKESTHNRNKSRIGKKCFKQKYLTLINIGRMNFPSLDETTFTFAYSFTISVHAIKTIKTAKITRVRKIKSPSDSNSKGDKPNFV